MTRAQAKIVTVLLCGAAGLACPPGDGTGLDPNGNLVTPPAADSVTLSGDVQPILTQNCAFAGGCHAGTSPAQNQNLSAGLAYANLVNVPANEAPGLMRVRPGQPDSSYLVHKIQGTQATVGGSGGRMPLGGTPLTAAQIARIRAWISLGAKNN